MLCYRDKNLTLNNLETIRDHDPWEGIELSCSKPSKGGLHALNIVLQGKQNIFLSRYTEEQLKIILKDLKPKILSLTNNDLKQLPVGFLWDGLEYLNLGLNYLNQETVDSLVFPCELETLLLTYHHVGDVDYSTMIKNLFTKTKIQHLEMDYDAGFSDELFETIVQKIHETKNFGLGLNCSKLLRQDLFENLAHPNLEYCAIDGLIENKLNLLPFLEKSTNTTLHIWGCKVNITFDAIVKYFIKSGLNIDVALNIENMIFGDFWNRVKSDEYKIIMTMLSPLSCNRVGVKSRHLRSLPQELYRLLFAALS